MLFMGLVTFIFLICSFRVNICFAVIFFSLLLCFIFLTAAYWLFAADFAGNAAVAGKLLVVSRSQ
jgi:succinate-acetate transporter protein